MIKVDEKFLRPNFCSLVRLKDRGFKLYPHAEEFIQRELNEVLLKLDESKVEVVVKPTNVISIQDRVKIKANELSGTIDDIIDEFIDNGCQHDFKAYTWFEENQMSPQIVKMIGANYAPLLIELENKENCPQLEEAYDYLTMANNKKYAEFISSIIRDADSFANKEKIKRKTTRKKKAPNVEKMVANFAYQSQDSTLKIASQAPVDIIGASEVWLYNSKNKHLKHLVALDESGFSISGSTIKNISESKSQEKTLRKPEVVVPRVIDGGKRILSKLMDELTTKASVPNGRSNNEMIILKVIK